MNKSFTFLAIKYMVLLIYNIYILNIPRTSSRNNLLSKGDKVMEVLELLAERAKELKKLKTYY